MTYSQIHKYCDKIWILLAVHATTMVLKLNEQGELVRADSG